MLVDGDLNALILEHAAVCCFCRGHKPRADGDPDQTGSAMGRAVLRFQQQRLSDSGKQNPGARTYRILALVRTADVLSGADVDSMQLK